MKIEENEIVHMQNFESKQKYKVKKGELRRNINELKD
jgi:hypothetical protein